jgi:hypothetical protein
MVVDAEYVVELRDRRGGKLGGDERDVAVVLKS